MQQLPKCNHSQLSKHCEYCQSLQREWYDKLAENGFDDAESNPDNLKVWSSIFDRNHSAVEWHAKAAYTQMAENFLEEYKFAVELEKTIWSYHANGLSNREIAKILKGTGMKISRETIRKVVVQFKKSMFAMYMMDTKAYHE